VNTVNGKSQYRKEKCLPSGFAVGDQLVLKLERVREWERPRRYLVEGVRAGTGTRRTGSEWRQDAAAERELGPL